MQDSFHQQLNSCHPAHTGAMFAERLTAVMERGSDTWRKLGQEILSLETNIDYIESMLLPEVEGGQEHGTD